MGHADERVEGFAAAIEGLRRHHVALTSGDVGLTAGHCTAALELVTRAEGVLASIKASLLLAYQASGRLGANGDKDLAGYAGRTLHRGRAGGRKEASMARGLAELRGTERDLVKGEITAGHAQILSDALGRASDTRRAALIDEGGEAKLLAAARRQDVAEFAKTVRRWEHSSDRAEADTAADVAYRARSLRTFTQRDGCVKVDALLDPIGGHALLVALDAVTPTKLAVDDERTGEQRRADALIDLALLANRGGAVKPGALTPTQVVVHMPAETLARGLAEQLVEPGACSGRMIDVRSPAHGASQTRGPAGGTIAMAAPGRGDLGWGETDRGDPDGDEFRHPEPGRPGSGHPEPGHLELGHPEPGLLEPGHPEPGHLELGRAGSVYGSSGEGCRAERRSGGHYQPATLDGGHPLSLTSAMMLVCDSALMRLVVDADGVPLDVGRSQRVWAKEQRLAIFARDQGCRYPGCGRPSRWCEVHHIHTWADGGVTSIDNGITLCRAHHTLVHNEAVRITPTTGGFRFTARTGLAVGENRHATADAAGSGGQPVRPLLSSGGRAARATESFRKRDVVAMSASA